MVTQVPLFSSLSASCAKRVLCLNASRGKTEKKTPLFQCPIQRNKGGIYLLSVFSCLFVCLVCLNTGLLIFNPGF